MSSCKKETLNPLQESAGNVCCSSNSSVEIKLPSITLNDEFDSTAYFHNQFLKAHYEHMHPHSYSCDSLFTVRDGKDYYVTTRYLDTIEKNFINYALTESLDTSALGQVLRNHRDILIDLNLIGTVNGKTVLKNLKPEIYNYFDNAVLDNRITQLEYESLKPAIDAYYIGNAELMDSLVRGINLANFNSRLYPSIWRFKKIYLASIDFWTNYYFDPTTASGKTSNSTQEKLPGWAKTAFIGFNDGTFGGAGAIAGTAFGPFGTIFGAGGGAAIGSGGAQWIVDLYEGDLNEASGCCCPPACQCVDR